MRMGRHGMLSLILFLVAGALIAAIIGQLLSQMSLAGIMPYFTETFEVFNFKDIYLNLAIIEIHLGLRFAPNLISILGILIAAWLWKRF